MGRTEDERATGSAGPPQPLDRFYLAPARFAAAVEQTGENPIAVALALCYCGHDPDWEHQEWLDTATIESPPPLAGKLQDTPISRCAQTRCQGEEE